MTYQIALAPNIDLAADAFIAAWNSDPHCRAVGTVQLAPERPAILDPTMGAALIEFGGILIAVVAGNALYDLIKELLLKQEVRTRTVLQEVPLQPGQHLPPVGRSRAGAAAVGAGGGLLPAGAGDLWRV